MERAGAHLDVVGLQKDAALAAQKLCRRRIRSWKLVGAPGRDMMGLLASLGKQRQQSAGRRVTPSSFGDQAGNQPRWSDVKGGVGGAAALRRDANRDDRPVRGLAGDGSDLGFAAFLDGDLADAVGDSPVDGGGWHGDVERHAIVLGGKRLEVGADLVGGVARCG